MDRVNKEVMNMNTIIMVDLPGIVLQYYLDMVGTEVMNMNTIIMVVH